MISSTERRTYVYFKFMENTGSKRDEARWDLGILYNWEFHKVCSLLSIYNKVKDVMMCADSETSQE
jgi:hypothetical protein